MGAWGEKAFQNDSALDWLAALQAGGVAALRGALLRVADTDEEAKVDVDDGASAIAAAEIVAAAMGQGRDRLTSEASAWVDAHPSSLLTDDLSLAKRAVERVLSGESELCALWDENGPENAWRDDVRLLIERLVTAGAKTTSTAGAAKRSRRPRVDERSKQVLLTFLGARGLQPNAQQLARIRASQDDQEIRRWLSRAVTAPSVAAVLDD